MVEYLDPAIAGEGIHVDAWKPGGWTDAPDGENIEWQPDIEPPHINDYAAFKTHKHYGQYFRPHRYRPFPAWVYHPTLEPKIVKSKEEVEALGPEWSPTPPPKRPIDMTGKSLPVKSDTQRLAEVIQASLGQRQGAAVDPNMIGAIVAAVMAAVEAKSGAAASAADPDPASLMPSQGVQSPDDGIERQALIELADKEGIKIDKRWSTVKIKEALGL